MKWLAFGLLLIFVHAGHVYAQVSYFESFTNNVAAGWVLGGNAQFTSGSADPVGAGYLRLTGTGCNEFGYAYLDASGPSSNGFLIEFEYGAWGGSGADGLTVFLFNGDNSVTFNPGAPGGSLGYANDCGVDGLSEAYVGIAFDEFGNFSNPNDRCHSGGPGGQLRFRGG